MAFGLMILNWLRRVLKSSALAITILFGILLLLGSYGFYLQQNRFTFLGIICFGNFYYLIFLLMMTIFWLFAKPKLAIVPILFLLIAYPSTKKIFKINQVSSFDKNKSDNDLRLMTWNTEGFKLNESKSRPELKSEMLQLIKEYNPDVACFQEVVASDSLKNAINYLPDMMTAIAMPYYSFVFNKRNQWDNHHYFGTLVCSKFPIKNTTHYAADNEKYTNYIQVSSINKNNEEYSFINCHLKSFVFKNGQKRYLENYALRDQVSDIKQGGGLIDNLLFGLNAHKAEADMINKIKDSIKGYKLVCGDFNDVPNSYAYENIGKGLKNCFEEKGVGLGRSFSKISPTLRIDNIFIDNGLATRQFKTIKKNLSDHYPLIVDVQKTIAN